MAASHRDHDVTSTDLGLAASLQRRHSVLPYGRTGVDGSERGERQGRIQSEWCWLDKANPVLVLVLFRHLRSKRR